MKFCTSSSIVIRGSSSVWYWCGTSGIGVSVVLVCVGVVLVCVGVCWCGTCVWCGIRVCWCGISKCV